MMSKVSVHKIFFGLMMLAPPSGLANDAFWVTDLNPSSNRPETAWSTQSLNAPTTAPSSPPREYFSLNTLYLGEHTLVHVGHDLINQNYVVFPSPNVQSIEKCEGDKVRVNLQQYFPEFESKIIKSYNITAEKLHYLYITSYEIFDQNGKLLEQIKIPSGVEYRPPSFYQIEVDKSVKLLTFVFGFTGRTGWSDSGISTDLQGLYREIRDIDVNGDSAIHMELKAGTGLKAYEVLTSAEDSKISKILSSLHFIVAWGRMAEREDLMSQIASLKKSEEINIDLSKGVEDLRKYPLVFGDPVDPKWHSVIKKISSEKLTEKDIKTEGSAGAKLGLGSFFNFDGSASKKKDSRMKDMVKFEMEGEFYVPKSIKFSLRANNTFTMINDLVFQAYSHFEEAYFRIGTGVALEEGPVKPRTVPPVTVASSTLSPETAAGAPIHFQCASGGVLSGFKNRMIPQTLTRGFQHECRQLSALDAPLTTVSCQENPNVFQVRTPVNFSCPADQFLAGEKSAVVLHQQDRTHAYSCCSLATNAAASSLPLKKKACNWSTWLNGYGGQVSYSCPAGTLMGGIRSEVVQHPRHKKIIDRRYQYECCSYALESSLN
jgi:hypothetical protein